MSSIQETRNAMYGMWLDYKKELSLTGAWFHSLFSDYSLYPYLDIYNKEVTNHLLKKSLLAKLFPVFAKGIRIDAILEESLGIDIFERKGRGIIEEVSDIILNEIESRKTIETRIESIRKSGYNFKGISYPIVNSDKPLYIVEPSVNFINNKLVSIEGHLVHVNSLEEVNQALFRSITSTGIQWLISDFPFFQMAPHNQNYNGGIVGLRFSEGLEELLGTSIPFNVSCGWFPYAKVFGIFHSSHSPQHPAFRVMDFFWLYFRAPKSFDAIPKLIGNNFFSSYNRRSLDDIQLLLSAIQISYIANSLTHKDARDDIRDLVDKALSKYEDCEEHIPSSLRSFYLE